jgi:hypothetical protein
MNRKFNCSILGLLYLVFCAGLLIDFVSRGMDVLKSATFGAAILLCSFLIICVLMLEKSIGANRKLGSRYPRWRYVLTYLLGSSLFVFPTYRSLSYKCKDYTPEVTYRYRVHQKGGRSFEESSNGTRLNRNSEVEHRAFGYALIAVWLGFTAYSSDLLLRSKKLKHTDK